MIPRDVSIPEASRSGSPAHRHEIPAPLAGRVGAPGPVFPPMMGSMPQGNGSGPDLTSLLKGLKRRWLLAFTLGILIACVAAGGAWYLLDPPYVAFTQLQVKAQVPGVVSVDQGGRDEFNRYLRSQAALIKTREVLEATINKSPEVKNLNLRARYPDPVAWLEQELMVDFQKDNELVRVLLSWDNPEEAKVIVKGVTQEYLNRFVKYENEQRRDRETQLGSLYTDKREELRPKKMDLEKREKPDKDTSPVLTKEEAQAKQQELLFNQGMAQADYQRLASAMILAEGELATAEKQNELLKKNVPISEALLSDAAMSDYKIKQLETDYQKYETLRDQYVRSGISNSNYRLVLAQLRKLEAKQEERLTEIKEQMRARATERIRAEQEAVVAGLKNKVARLQEQKKLLAAQILELAKSAKVIEKDTAENEIAREEIHQVEVRLAQLGHQHELAKMDVMAGDRVTFSGVAALEQRNHKKRILATGMAFVAAFFAVCLGIGWWEYRRRKVQSSSQIDGALGLRVLGSIPTTRHAERLICGEMSEILEEELFLESVDAIRTTLLHAAQRDDRRVLMVSSAEDGEGKTILASHLANSLARAGRKTLLIDGDLRFPGIHTLFEVAQEPGLCEILMGESDSVDAIQATKVDGVMVLPAGQCDREVLQALARDGMQDILSKLREEFDFIIIDSHQVLGATDALLLGQHVDAVLMTVLRDVSHIPHVQAASQRLQSVGIPVLGVVVNGLDPQEVYANTVSYSTSAA